MTRIPLFVLVVSAVCTTRFWPSSGNGVQATPPDAKSEEEPVKSKPPRVDSEERFSLAILPFDNRSGISQFTDRVFTQANGQQQTVRVDPLSWRAKDFLAVTLNKTIQAGRIERVALFDQSALDWELAERALQSNIGGNPDLEQLMKDVKVDAYLHGAIGMVSIDVRPKATPNAIPVVVVTVSISIQLRKRGSMEVIYSGQFESRKSDFKRERVEQLLSENALQEAVSRVSEDKEFVQQLRKLVNK